MMKSLLWAAAASLAVSCGILAWRRVRRSPAARQRVRRVRDRLARAVREKPRSRRRAAGRERALV